MKTFFFNRVLWGLLLLAVAPVALAQLTNCKQKDAAAIKNSMLYVVLKPGDGEMAVLYNAYLHRYMERYWTFSKFRFVHPDTADRMIMNKNVYVMREFDEEIISNNGPIHVSSIGIVRGGKALSKYKHTEELAWVYIRKDLWDYSPRFANLVQVLQNALVWRANPANKKKDIYTSFNKAGELREKVLYIEKKDLSEKQVDVQKIAKAYTFKFRIVETAELEKAVGEQDPNVVYMHFTNNRNASCFLIAANGGEVIWEHQASINTDMQLVNIAIFEELNADVEAAPAESK